MNVSKTFSWPVKVWVLLRNEMHCGGFSCLPNLLDLDHIYIFFQNTICRNVQIKTSSKFTEFFFWKIKKLTRHLQRPLQLRPKKHGSFRNRRKKGTNGSSLTKKKKYFAGNFQMEKTMQYSLGSEQITFKLTAHETSEGHTMSSAAKRASKRPREERPLPAALSRLDEET